jgi:DNA-binding HxlR family transcriptional regulator
MSSRSYNQFCTLAMSLDVIGERWTLLIVRELLSGPKRFTDLLEGLPGIGTNLLSRRLKSMENYDLVTWRRLPPPAASAVYELTDIGHALEPAIVALAQWGITIVEHKKVTRKNLSFKASWAILGMKYLFSEEIARQFEGTCELHVDEEVMHVTVSDGKVNPQLGPAESPTLLVKMNLRTYKELLLMERNLKELVTQGKVTVEGRMKDAQLFYDLFMPAINVQLEESPAPPGVLD